MTKVLLTGFEAYGHTPHNPSEAVARALDGKFVDDSKVISRIVPNVFFECIDYVIEAISEIQPDVVVMLGEYGGRPNITVERIAQNLNDSTRYELVDNHGVALQDKPTVVGGPVAYCASLPIRAMVKTMRESGIPADISDASGTFCCNHLMYGILHYVSTNNLPIRAGWIHLPHLPSVAAMQENLGAPSMSAETSTEGVEICIRAILENSDDIDEPIISRLQV
ncbi:MAG: pyroglutamyl-peptidase I [Proteobacteria bacterium]|nr:pyroglutamyl-peptidase I [Pseudomonadota bacterium]